MNSTLQSLGLSRETIARFVIKKVEAPKVDRPRRTWTPPLSAEEAIERVRESKRRFYAKRRAKYLAAGLSATGVKIKPARFEKELEGLEGSERHRVYMALWRGKTPQPRRNYTRRMQ